MDYDIPVPSIEKDDPLHAPVNTALHSSPAKQQNTPDHGANNAGTHLPQSTPSRSTRKTPRLERDVPSSKPQPYTPSRSSSTSSPLNPNAQPATPPLRTKRSVTNLQSSRGETPLRPSSLRRTSPNFSRTTLGAAGMDITNGVTSKQGDGRPEITAASIAKTYFEKELALHNTQRYAEEKTLVLIHDSCYGHRYSRPRTSKAVLSTIVERPERIHASIFGLATAYVRMGGRYAGGGHPPHPSQTPDSTPVLPFRIQKTSRTLPLSSAAVTHVHGQRWMQELQIMCDSAEGKLALNGRELVRPIGFGKDEEGIALPKLHEGDLYLCSESLNALEGCLGGVCEAVDTVCGPGSTDRAFVCIRPPGHHCSSNYPSGFCWLNNVHVGIAHAAINHELTHAAIIDFDLHHGDGSQAIAWDHNRKALNLPKTTPHYRKTPIGYFSLHDINSYPCEMGDEEKVRNASLCIENAHGQSIWNVHLEPWKTHADFWRLYESRYSILLDKTRAFLRQHTSKLSTSGSKPKAAIFLSAGFDASEWEGEGMQRHKVNVPTDFYAKFTSDIVSLAQEEGLGVDGRVVSVLEGGYSDRALTSGVLSHVCGLSDGLEVLPGTDMDVDARLSSEMRTKMGLPTINGGTNSDEQKLRPQVSFQSDWWALHNLEALEALVKPPASTAKLGKDKMTGNYTSPTQASTAKINEQARERRSLSAQLDGRMSLEPETAPLPEVDWATASFVLSRLIIPADRQTMSYRHDELNAEATKQRRDRQSTIGLPASDDQRMLLRERKPRPAETESKPTRARSRSNTRRKTITAADDLPDPSLIQVSGQPSNTSTTGRPRRKSSGASSMVSAMEGMQIGGSASDGVESRQALWAPTKPPKPTAERKPRVATGPKLHAVKPRTSPKKANGAAPPVPRVPSTFVPRKITNDSDVAGEEIVTGEKQSSQERAEAAPRASKIDDVDNLSSGMRKMTIKLKVPSSEENAARERKAKEDKARKRRAPKKPVVPKDQRVFLITPGQKAPALNGVPISEAIPDTIINLPLQTLESPSEAAGELGQGDRKIHGPASTELNSSSAPPKDFITLALEDPQPCIAKPAPTMGGDVMSSYQSAPVQPLQGQGPHQESVVMPETHDITQKDDAPLAQKSGIEPFNAGDIAIPIIEMKSRVVPDLPPLTPKSLPSPAKKTKADLPVFTSNSPIPFAKSKINSASDADTNRGHENEDRRALGHISNPAHPLVDAGPSKLVSNQEISPPTQDIAEVKAEHVNFGPAAADSIWEVPETPRR